MVLNYPTDDICPCDCAAWSTSPYSSLYQSVGATKQGQMFLLTKAMIEQSIALNTTIYLLVKSFIAQDIEGSQDIDAHPVMHQLKAASLLEEKLVENVVGKTENLQEQMKNLVKAATLLIDHAGIIPDIRIQDSGTSFQGERKEPDIQPKIVDTSSSANFSGQIYESRSCDAVANEVRFGLRHHEIGGKRKTERRRVATFSDFGDGNEDDTIPRSLAATINTIDQRAASDYGKGKARHSTEETDYFEEKVEVTAGIRIMEDELEGIHGKDFSDESNGAANNLISNESEENDSNWYNKIAEKATMKKQIKEQMHRVAPKFPRLEAEVSGKFDKNEHF